MEILQSEVTQLKRKHRQELEQLTDTIKRIKREHKQALDNVEKKVFDVESQVGGALKQMVLQRLQRVVYLKPKLYMHATLI